MRINLGRWHSMQGYGPFEHSRPDVPLYVQFSGGRTSAFLASMAPDEAVFTFQNTSREDEKTLEFVQRNSDALGRDVTWLEWRPPPRLGDRPMLFRWERVAFETATRDGSVFAEFMRYINAYHCAKPLIDPVTGKVLADTSPPIAPWANQRICTTYLKHRTLDRYLNSIGTEGHERWLGLRFDEPARVARLCAQETQEKTLRAPLYLAEVTKELILEHWSRQPFDLDLAEYDGNCRGCFLKDYGDISRALGSHPDEIEWWAHMQETWPRFGGQSLPLYRDLAAEYPIRLAIEETLRAGGEPVNVTNMDPRRFKLTVRQEARRLRDGPSTVSCACEGSM